MLTQESFDQLLLWLDGDRERAGQRYEELRLRLIRKFARRGCPVAEELADQTIDRVVGKVGQIADGYVGDPALYFYRVAQYVFLEYVRKQPNPLPLPPPEPGRSNEIERRHNCLDRCLDGFDGNARTLILHYYSDERRAKIDRRAALARDLGISVNALRMRAHRIKLELQRCIDGCLAGFEPDSQVMLLPEIS